MNIYEIVSTGGVVLKTDADGKDKLALSTNKMTGVNDLEYETRAMVTKEAVFCVREKPSDKEPELDIPPECDHTDGEGESLLEIRWADFGNGKRFLRQCKRCGYRTKQIKKEEAEAEVDIESVKEAT